MAKNIEAISLVETDFDELFTELKDMGNKASRLKLNYPLVWKAIADYYGLGFNDATKISDECFKMKIQVAIMERNEILGYK